MRTLKLTAMRDIAIQAAKLSFQEGTFVIFCDMNDNLCLYFKDTIMKNCIMVFYNTVKTFLSDVTVKIEIIPKDDKFWEV